VRDRVSGSVWWEPFADAMMQEVLQVALPERVDALSAFQNVAALAMRTIEDRAVTVGEFLLGKDARDSPVLMRRRWGCDEGE
jgi:hypothetical protein